MCVHHILLFQFQVKRLTTLVCLRKPRNARVKRALDAREPKEIEDTKTAIFVRGTHTGERLNNVMKELVRV